MRITHRIKLSENTASLLECRKVLQMLSSDAKHLFMTVGPVIFFQFKAINLMS